jgi:flagellar basal body-associated protein FliL
MLVGRLCLGVSRRLSGRIRTFGYAANRRATPIASIGRDRAFQILCLQGALAVGNVWHATRMKPFLKSTLIVLLCGVACTMAGCGESDDFEFDELDLTPTQDELIEYPLGKYIVPIPLVQSASLDTGVKRNRVEFAFSLYALVNPECKQKLASQWKRHEGKVRDRVILVCRNATAEDLQESELAKLKSHLTDAIHAELGKQCIRRLLISDVVVRKL